MNTSKIATAGTLTSNWTRMASAASDETAFTSIGICPVVFGVIQNEIVTPSIVGTWHIIDAHYFSGTEK